MRTILLLLSLLAALPARAESYRVDLIVFRNWGGEGELGGPLEAANLSGAIDPADAPGLARSGIVLLPDDQFGLAAEWASLKASPQFRPLLRLAWTQLNPPAERGPGIMIRTGARLIVADPGALTTREVPEIEGRVALLLGRFLHFDADLVLAEKHEDGVVTWPLRESRRLRRDELNHLDSPRLGLLVRVTRPELAPPVEPVVQPVAPAARSGPPATPPAAPSRQPAPPKPVDRNRP